MVRNLGKQENLCPKPSLRAPVGPSSQEDACHPGSSPGTEKTRLSSDFWSEFGQGRAEGPCREGAGGGCFRRGSREAVSPPCTSSRPFSKHHWASALCWALSSVLKVQNALKWFLIKEDASSPEASPGHPALGTR